MRIEIDTVTPLLNVADVGRSLGWYAHLGFQEVRRFESDGALIWALAVNGPHRLMLNRSTTISAEERQARPHYGDVVLYFAVASAHDAHAALAAAGLKPGPVERQDYGVDEFVLRDPDGYEVAVTSELMQIAHD
ncbi:MAG: VOC family protein [Alphaproteobacteria bacterium]